MPPRKRVPQGGYIIHIAEQPTKSPDHVSGFKLRVFDPSECSGKAPLATRPHQSDALVMKPLEDRIIETVDDSIRRMSNLLITDPSKIGEPEIVAHAKKEMLRFNASKYSSHSNSAKCPGQPVAEMFAAFGSMRDRESSEATAPIFSQLQSSNPLVPKWSIPARSGAFQRFHELIRSNYSATSRPSVMTAVIYWVRFCASLGITPSRPQVATDWDGKVSEEVTMIPRYYFSNISCS